MPGRQAHGRPLLPSNSGSKSRPPQKKSRNTARSKALDAFAIAEAEVPETRARGIRTRDLEEEPERPQKRNRDDDDDDDDEFDEDDDDAEPQTKRPKKNGDDFEGFSDSEAESEEWHVGVNEEDEDSDIDSDEAFGESDNEKFDGYAFSGSASTKKRKKGKRGGEEEEEEEEEDSDLESLGSDAIDLATALDQFEEEEEEEEEDGEEDGSSEEGNDSDDQSSESEDDDEDDEKLDALENMISGFAGGDDSDEDQAPQGAKPKVKLSLADLGLGGVKDPQIKKALKLMNKEDKATKPGTSKKLAVPLAKRQEDKLLRSAAYEKTSQTLERWVETVKTNRRADHLMFPLAQNAHDRGLDSSELQPITQKTATTDLEQTILSIMEESGLGPAAKAEQKRVGPDGEKLSQAELQEIQRQRRRERELHSREQARAKRIKKIKSKAYRRVHRKELAKEEQAEHDALVAAGEIDSEDEREAQDRRRALERVGTKHRESKWAKLGKKAGRAVWDDDFRSGLTEMAQRKEELRRRVEGRTDRSDDDGDSDSGGSVDSGDGYEKDRLLKDLDAAAAYEDDGEPQSKLMAMAFMQRGEALRRKENDDLVDQIRRDLDSDHEGEDSDAEGMDIGRRQFGMGKKEPMLKVPDLSGKKSKGKTGSVAEPVIFRSDVARRETTSAPEPEAVSTAPGAAGAWARAGAEGAKPKKKKGIKERVDELDLLNTAALATKPKAKSSKKATANGGKTATDVADDSDDEDAIHLPMAIRDQELIKRAFAGDDAVGEFEREKAEIQKEDDDKEIDNTLPGWGSWAGEGVSARDKSRHKGRFVTKVQGIKQKDRKDYKLKSVIINEKRVKKNDQFLASQLPHPFESQQQYERSLRLPVGPEWTTKETYQEATKPRVLIKQGIIAPMSKPMV